MTCGLANCHILTSESTKPIEPSQKLQTKPNPKSPKPNPRNPSKTIQKPTKNSKKTTKTIQQIKNLRVPKPKKGPYYHPLLSCFGCCHASLRDLRLLSARCPSRHRNLSPAPRSERLAPWRAKETHQKERAKAGAIWLLRGFLLDLLRGFLLVLGVFYSWFSFKGFCKLSLPIKIGVLAVLFWRGFKKVFWFLEESFWGWHFFKVAFVVRVSLPLGLFVFSL